MVMYTEQKYKLDMQQFLRFYCVTVHIRKSVNLDTFIRVLFYGFDMNGQGHSRGWAWEVYGDRPTHWGARPSQSELVFSVLRFISCPSSWSQMIPQVKKPDVEALGWRGYTWSAVVRPVGRTLLRLSLPQT